MRATPEEEMALNLDPTINPPDVRAQTNEFVDYTFRHRGLRQRELLKLITTFQRPQFESLDEGERACNIYFERYAVSPDDKTLAEEPAKLPCGHCFGQEYIEEWLEDKKILPSVQREHFREELLSGFTNQPHTAVAFDVRFVEHIKCSCTRLKNLQEISR